MKIPSKLRIAGHIFNIRRVPTLSDDSGVVLSGCCCVGELYIAINSSLPQAQQVSTLFHEVIEALNALMELGLEHRAISSLESGIYQVLVDNKLLKE